MVQSAPACPRDYLGGVLTDVVTWLGAALVAVVVVLRVRTKRADRRRDRDTA